MTFERRWGASAAEQLQRTRLIEQARLTDAAVGLRRCCPSAARVLESLSSRALTRLAANEAVDPNDPDSWRSPDAHAQIVLRCHGITGLDSTRLTMETVRALIDGQARADRDAGLDWTGSTSRGTCRRRITARSLPAADLARRPRDLRLPRRPGAGTRRLLGVPGERAGELSRWLLTHPDAFDADDLRCWRIASARWLALADEQLPAVGHVERPIGLFLAPAEHEAGWQLAPVLSLDAIRLLHSLGAGIEYDLRSAVLPLSAGNELLERVNQRTLHAGPNEHLDSAAGLSEALTRELGDRSIRAWRASSATAGDACSSSADRAPAPTAPPAQISCCACSPSRAGLPATAGRRCAARRARRAAERGMELGEAVQSAIERELPLLLSSESPTSSDSVRVGRMKGRPGMLTITTADGLSEYPPRRRRAGRCPSCAH